VPFKLNSKDRHHIPRQRHRVTNWRDYDTALRDRGSLTIWFTEEALAGWKAQPRTTPGGQRHYSDLAIETALTLRAAFSIGLASGRRLDRVNHVHAEYRFAGSRSYDAEPACIRSAGSAR
jgi:hypothetical protein